MYTVSSDQSSRSRSSKDRSRLDWTRGHLLFDIYRDFGGLEGIENGGRHDFLRMLNTHQNLYGCGGKRADKTRKSVDNTLRKWKDMSTGKFNEMLAGMGLQNLPMIHRDWKLTSFSLPSTDDFQNMAKFSFNSAAASKLDSDEKATDPSKKTAFTPEFKMRKPKYCKDGVFKRHDPILVDEEHCHLGFASVHSTEAVESLDGEYSFSGGIIVVEAQLIGMLEDRQKGELYEATVSEEDQTVVILKMPAFSHDLRRHRDQIEPNVPTRHLAAYDAGYGVADMYNQKFVEFQLKFPWKVTARHISANAYKPFELPLTSIPMQASSEEVGELISNGCHIQFEFIREDTSKKIGSVTPRKCSRAAADLIRKVDGLSILDSSSSGAPSVARPPAEVHVPAATATAPAAGAAASVTGGASIRSTNTYNLRSRRGANVIPEEGPADFMETDNV